MTELTALHATRLHLLHDEQGQRDVLRRLAQLGIDLDEVSADLEIEGASSFVSAFSALRGVLEAKPAALAAR